MKLRRLFTSFVLFLCMALSALAADHQWQVAPWGSTPAQVIQKLKSNGMKFQKMEDGTLAFLYKGGEPGYATFKNGKLVSVWEADFKDWTGYLRIIAEGLTSQYGPDDLGNMEQALEYADMDDASDVGFFRSNALSRKCVLIWTSKKDGSSICVTPLYDEGCDCLIIGTLYEAGGAK